MRIVHLSDLHFGRRVQIEKVHSLREDLARVAADLIAVTGDLTDTGRVSEFRSAKDFLASLGTPYLAVPGNREICATAPWEWMFPPLAMRRFRYFFGPSDRILFESQKEKIVLFGLNSVHPFPSWPGKINRESRYWFKEKAAGFSDCIKVVLLHHPVLPVVRSSSYWAHVLSDAAEILNICTQSGVSLILQGHKHRASVAEVFLPERDARVVISACGAPFMPHWDSAYQVIEISRSSIAVESRKFENGTFQYKDSYEFSLNGKGGEGETR